MFRPALSCGGNGVTLVAGPLLTAAAAGLTGAGCVAALAAALAGVDFLASAAVAF